ncbi:MAG: 5-formyltetrahydrofolate cyclo-ligase [Pseudomonadota bacterium]
MPIDPMAEAKVAARKAAFARRKAAFDADRAAGFPGVSAAATALLDVVGDAPEGAVSGYMPIRSEMSPLPAMTSLAATRTLCVPVIQGKGQPLLFHRWTPETEMVEGPFGAQVPREAEIVLPRVVIVPLVAFDRNGGRLGYGGGFYDRTLAHLRRQGPVRAIGLAYGAQEALDPLPREATDQPLDGLVTEEGLLTGG